jgi:hypothetical protein
MKKKFVIFMTFGELWKYFSLGFSILGAWLPDGMSWDIPRVFPSVLNGSSVSKHILFFNLLLLFRYGQRFGLTFSQQHQHHFQDPYCAC